MSIKILTSNVIGLEEFRQDPIGVLSSAKAGTVAVFDKNIPVLYALSPERMAKLMKLEESVRQHVSDVTLDEQLYHVTSSLSSPQEVPVGKFMMYADWRPDPDFQRQAAIWGITLSEPVTSAELAAFITWWQAEGRLFYHVQWQQKLARSIQQSRLLISNGHVKRDINKFSEPNQSIPDGFRGEQ